MALVENARHWLGLIRFSHTIFALPFALLATALAFAAPMPSGQTPTIRLQDLVGIVLCMVFARSAAMAFNRLVDRKIDAANPRTRQRHLPAGVLSAAHVTLFTVLCGAAFVLSTLLFLPNRWPLALSIPVLLFLLGYSLAKRFTWAVHFWLGTALSLSPLAAWIAIRGGDPSIGWSDLVIPAVLAIVVALWCSGFDIIYACQDAAYDAQAELSSVPAKFGVAGALRIAAGLHFLMLVALVWFWIVGWACGLNWFFALALLAVGGLVIRQHALVRPDDLGRVNEAFFHTNAMISLILLAAGVVDSFWL